MSWAKWMLRAYRPLVLILVLALLAGCTGFSLNMGKEPVELTFVYLEQAADYGPLAQAFQDEHPNITIKLDPVEANRDQGRVFELKMAEADAIRYPVFGVNDEVLASFLPLDLQITSSSDFPQGDLFPGSLEGLQLNGKQMGIPAGLNPFVVYYSPQKFTAAGVQPPLPGWSLEEFVSTAMAVHNTEAANISSPNYAYGFCSHPSLADGAIFTYLFGGGLFDNLYQVSAPTLNRLENIDALAWYASLKNDFGLIPPIQNIRGVGELVARSGCGFWMDWLDRSTFLGYGPDDSVPLPLPSYHKQFGIATLDGYFVMAESTHPEESWQWIAFLMSQQAASGRLVPPMRSAIDSADYEARAQQPVVNMARSLPQDTVILGFEMYRNERFGRVLELYSDAAAKIFDGTLTDVEDALNMAQLEAEKIFK